MYTLSYQPPYDWPWILGFLRGRAVEGVEVVADNRYQRSFSLGEHAGLVTLEPDEKNLCLNVTLSDGLEPVADAVLQRVKNLLDLDRDPHQVLNSLGSLAAARPGLRLPGCMDPFEQAIRAILGQLVSVAMAAKLTGKVARAYGTKLEGFDDWYLFPSAGVLANVDIQQLKSLGMSLKRAEAIVHLAGEVVTGQFPLQLPDDLAGGIKNLIALPGIGRWTANYFALRGWQARDVFLPDDYLIKQRFPDMTTAQIRRYAERWQPWRSYALLHIWYSDGWAPVS
ncbi:DNA-3-methyladenine glycosylase 2 [Beauveria bassiana D1-5]|uniref:DNA-3-methyladenine glycosylase 2 n=1 Tax=Beauveria bassiana D1-5 TaxID=1245745 RepID=A0A0A2W6A4_BEABA|nr:DNA-3-methyladenine glycosylase 2 [Cedecea neteri]AJZ90194.1 3-methyladenine DNA glycosylase [Klebsiella michiganensis]KGQ13985.1 DNA-3-methyladenine glycosylase 2 [Beauveria bassiana D1-5]WPU24642.1 DNA-3-methyladenine glycosylase 2 [Cedecea neteri]